MQVFDPSKTYILGMYGDPAEDHLIQSLYEYNSLPHIIAAEHRWTHIAALFYDHEWRIIESHGKKGTREYSYDEWMHNNPDMFRIEAYQCELDIEKMRSFVGQPFPKKYILKKMRYKNEQIKRKPGHVYCSELIGLCDGELVGEPAMSHPAHYQIWAIANDVPMIVVRNRPLEHEEELPKCSMNLLTLGFAAGV